MLSRKRNVVGFDVVELCPSPGNKSPDFIAAKIIYQLLSYRFARYQFSTMPIELTLGFA